MILLAAALETIASPLEYRTFTSGAAVWLCASDRITTWRSDTRTARVVRLTDSLDVDSISDVSASDGTLWVLARSGLYSIDMATGTTTRVTAPTQYPPSGKCAADYDYVWVTGAASLDRYDKLSREWQSFSLPDRVAGTPTCGLYSDGDVVYLFGCKTLATLSIADEKWAVRPIGGFELSTSTTMLLDKSGPVFVDSLRACRYLVAAQSWDVVRSPAPILDILPQDTALYMLSADGVFRYDTRAAVITNIDIPDTRGAMRFARLGDELIIATPRAFVRYAISTKASATIDLPPQVDASTTIEALVALGTNLVAKYPAFFASFDLSTQVWESSAVAAKAARRVFSWDDDNGMRVQYTPRVGSQLRGSVQQDFRLTGKDSAYIRTDTITDISDTAIRPVLYWGNLLPSANLTLHNTFGRDRYLDIHFDNIDRGRSANRYIQYSGARADNIAGVRVGSADNQTIASPTLPVVRFEGGNAEIESRRFLRNRDRKIVRTQLGGGLLTTSSFCEVLPYRQDEQYNIRGLARDTSGALAIVPGSMTIAIDGQRIDSTLYSFSPLTGDIRFSRRDILDPTSVIVVSYRLQTVPQGIKNRLEFIPERHLGDFEYASATVSPSRWLSARAGVFTLQPGGVSLDTTNRRTLLDAALPLEFRRERPDLYLSLTPEMTWTASGKGLAGGLTMQSRLFKKVGFTFDGIVADDDFRSIDNMSKGFGSIRNRTEFSASYDVLPEIPLKYTQYDGLYQLGQEHRYEVSAGAHFARFPNGEVSLSRNRVDGKANFFILDVDTLIDTAYNPPDTTYPSTPIDTTMDLDRLKDKLKIKLYETSSPIVEKLLHLAKLSYEVSYTGFLTQKEEQTKRGAGNIWYLQTTISPIASIALTGNGTFRNNPPGSIVRTQFDPELRLLFSNAPPGVDLTLRYAIDYAKLDTAWRSISSIERSVNLILRPGAWTSVLSWASPRIGIAQSSSCQFDSLSPGFGDVVFGMRGMESRTTSPTLGLHIYPTGEITFRNENGWSLVDVPNIDTIITDAAGNLPDTLDTLYKFTNRNPLARWFTGHPPARFKTFNDLKWYFGSARLWQTRLEYQRDPSTPTLDKSVTHHYIQGWSRFEGTWLPWLKTATGITSNHRVTDFVEKQWVDSMFVPDSARWIMVSDSLPFEKRTYVTRTGPEISITFTPRGIGPIKKLINGHTLNLYWQNSHGHTRSSPDIGYSFFLKAVLKPNFFVQSTNSFSWSTADLQSYNGTISAGMLF